MPQFNYEVRDSQGNQVKGTLETVSRERAVRFLQDQQMVVVSIKEVQPRWAFMADMRRLAHRWGYQRVGVRDLALFTRQLSLLLAAGVPITKALESLRDQIWTSAYMRVVCVDLLSWVHEGNRLSVAFNQHPRLFSEAYVSLIRAGEESGTLVDILDRLSAYVERDYRLTQKIKSSLVYPAFVFTISIVVVFLMCSYILPMFLSFFQGMALRMPPTTRALITVAAFFGNPWVIGAFLAILPLILYQIHLMNRMASVRVRLELFLLSLPAIGHLYVQVVLARFCRTAAILLDCGLGQMQTLDLLGEVVGSVVIGDEIDQMRSSIRDGRGNFSSELLLTTFFPPICGHMLKAAEESGTMPLIFVKLADFFDEEVDQGTIRVLALIEPLMLGIMGFIVGAILLSVFQPIYALLETL